MKKPTAVILTMLFGLVGSALVCAAGVFAYSTHIVVYIIVTAVLILIYANVLISVVEGIAESRGTWRGNPALVLKGNQRVRRKAKGGPPSETDSTEALRGRAAIIRGRQRMRRKAKGGPPSEKALLICAQAPILVVSLAYFISELAVYKPPSGGTFVGGSFVHLGYGLGMALCMFVTAVLTTAATFFIAARTKKIAFTSRKGRTK